MPKLREVTPRVRVGPALGKRNITIFPLFPEAPPSPASYKPVGDAIREGTARITEISEGGSVPTLALDNLDIVPVLIIDGEELIGAKQNRIVNVSILAPGKRTLPLPVSCVERGRWSYQKRDFTESPHIMYAQARAQKSRDVSESLARHAMRFTNQGGLWANIASLQVSLGFASPTESMHDVYNDQKKSIDGYVNGVEAAEGQIGVIVAINGVAAGVELFDSPDTLRTYLPKIMRSYALDAIVNHSASAELADAAEATRLLDSILDLDARSFPAVGLGEDLRIESPDITGGALSHNGQIVHLAAFNTAPPKKNQRN
jgi:hypothetical protein